MKDLPRDLARELFYLLVRVAWVDLNLSTAEKIAIFELGLKLGLDTTETTPIGNALEASEPIPYPNIDLLRSHKMTVMQAIERVITADGELSDVEVELGRAIAERLIDG